MSIIAHSLQQVQRHLQTQLTSALDGLAVADATLQQAMHYSLLNGGKRIRPFLLYHTADMFAGTWAQADSPAIAIEMLHSYSLVHDDLPAMDNDELRRGQPTCHIKYDEATAILAGDALLTGAFEQLTHAPFAAEIRLKLVALLARAAGAAGMVAGQSCDLSSVGKPINLAQLEAMHRLKTGALIQAAVLMGAHCGTLMPKSQELAALSEYADAIGLAFQVQDDLLDVLGNTQTLGKVSGADEALNKPTYPALLGIDGATKQAQNLVITAKNALLRIPYQSDLLAQLADYIIQREH